MKAFAKSIAIAVILLTSLPLSAYSYNNQPKQAVIHNKIAQKTGTIAYSKISFGGIKLSMSEAQVKKILGKPAQVKDSNSVAVGKIRNLIYKDINIDLVEDVDKKGIYSVYKINTKSSKYVTSSGIRVGDTRAKVLKIYGKTTESKEGKTILLGYQGDLKDAPAALIFRIENGKVVEIFGIEQLT